MDGDCATKSFLFFFFFLGLGAVPCVPAVVVPAPGRLAARACAGLVASAVSSSDSGDATNLVLGAVHRWASFFSFFFFFYLGLNRIFSASCWPRQPLHP